MPVAACWACGLSGNLWELSLLAPGLLAARWVPSCLVRGRCAPLPRRSLPGHGPFVRSLRSMRVVPGRCATSHRGLALAPGGFWLSSSPRPWCLVPGVCVGLLAGRPLAFGRSGNLLAGLPMGHGVPAHTPRRPSSARGLLCRTRRAARLVRGLCFGQRPVMLLELGRWASLRCLTIGSLKPSLCRLILEQSKAMTAGFSSASRGAGRRMECDTARLINVTASAAQWRP